MHCDKGIPMIHLKFMSTVSTVSTVTTAHSTHSTHKALKLLKTHIYKLETFNNATKHANIHNTNIFRQPNNTLIKQ